MNIFIGLFGLISFSLSIYLGLSLKRIKRNQVGAIYARVRGKQKPIKVIRGPALAWVPFGSREIKRATTKPQTRVRPDPKKLQIDTNARLEGDKVYPLEISHSPFELAKFFSDPPSDEEKKSGPKNSFDSIVDDKRKKAIEMDLYQQSNISRIRYVVRIRINPDNFESIYHFFKTTGSFDKAWEIVTEAADAILEDLLAKITMREAINHQSVLSTIFQTLLQQMVQEGAKTTPSPSGDKTKQTEEDKGEPYGFDIDRAYIEDISPNPAVKAAQDEAVAAQSKVNSEQQRVEAEAKNKKTTADADKYVKVVSAEGDSEALKKRGEAVLNEGAAMIFAADNLKEALKGAIVVDADKAINMWIDTGLPNPLKHTPKRETAVK